MTNIHQLTPDSFLQSEPGNAYRLVQGEVEVSLPDSGEALTLCGNWNYFYWHNTDVAGVQLRAASDTVEVEEVSLSQLAEQPIELCAYLSEAFMHYLLLRLNLFSHERHVKQVFKFYQTRYSQIYDTLAETMIERGRQMLLKRTTVKHRLDAEEKEDARKLSVAGDNLGNTFIFTRSKKAESGVYIVRDNKFSLLLDDVEVLSFLKDEIVYLPHEVVSLPGYMMTNDHALQKVCSNLAEFLQMLKTCPGVVSRFISQFSRVNNVLLQQCLQVHRSCRSIRENIANQRDEDCLALWFEKILAYCADDESLKGFSSQAEQMLGSCNGAVEKLLEEDRSICMV